MRRVLSLSSRAALAVFIGVAILALPASAAPVEVRFLYRLSSFSGVVPYSDVQVHADRFHDEVYVGEGDLVRVFNATGMEIYQFHFDAAGRGSALSLVVDEKGDILILSYQPVSETGIARPILTRCDYRGEPKETFWLQGLPDGLTEFNPNRMFYSGKKLYLASTSSFQVVVAATDGTFERVVDLRPKVEISEKQAEGAEIGGMDVANDGTILFTVPTYFMAFAIPPDGTMRAWGRAGSGPGNFGIVQGIVEDDQGNYLVADRARDVVMVFDKNLAFVREFGARGKKAESLTRPGILALGNGGRLFVTQLAMKGISVFSVTPPDAP